MSNALAIAAVTATLRNLLTQGVTMVPDLADTVVTTHLPDTARPSGTTANQINLFLYQTVLNAAWRNADLPGQTRPGETGAPPLALNLYYLLTTYGRDNDVARPFSHELLGRSMSVLHDHPLLGAAEIATALPGNDLGGQFERIRFSLQPLGVEEIYRLWTGFQTPYRTSVAYEASVVLIDSLRETQAPLPVLRRGPSDRGATMQANASASGPAIASISPNRDVTFGDTLLVAGRNLAGGDAVSVNFSLSEQTRTVAVLAGSSATLARVQIPNDPAFRAGKYALSVSVSTKLPDGSTQTRTSRPLDVVLAPQITSGVPATVVAQNGIVALTLGCAPDLADGQRVSLIFGTREIAAEPATRPANRVSFTIPGVTPGAYFVRLRVDGADSTLLEDRTVSPAVFDPARKVTVT